MCCQNQKIHWNPHYRYLKLLDSYSVSYCSARKLCSLLETSSFRRLVCKFKSVAFKAMASTVLIKLCLREPPEGIYQLQRAPEEPQIFAVRTPSTDAYWLSNIIKSDFTAPYNSTKRECLSLGWARSCFFRPCERGDQRSASQSPVYNEATRPLYSMAALYLLKKYRKSGL